MDTRPKIDPARYKRVLSINFNEDKSCFSIGLEDGFMVLSSKDASVLLKKELMAGIGFAQILGSSNVIALVGGGRRPWMAANKVQLLLWNEHRERKGFEIATLEPIQAVRVTNASVVLALQNSVLVYRMHTGELLYDFETANNVNGIVALSNKHVAFPGRTDGQIQIVELMTGDVSIIPAHDTPLRALAFSWDGQLLASASDKGTIIRVYSTANCANVCEVRRGMDAAKIFDLCFSPTGSLLACTSDKGTLHIFDIPHPGRQPEASHSASANTSPPALPSGSRPGSSSGNDGKGKWGLLAQVPGLPRLFSDTYSFASIPFTTGDEPEDGAAAADATQGTTKPQKGIIGWYTEETLVVVGAGTDARWEKYQIAKTDDGKRFIARIGWKRYYKET